MTLRQERQIELSSEFERLWTARSTSMEDKVWQEGARSYVSPDVLAQERSRLFRGRYLMFCLAADVKEPGNYHSADLDGIPVVAVRGEDGIVRALVNACTHRGAKVFEEDRGHIQRRGIACPFHAWTFDLYGRLLGQPLAKEGFEQCPPDSLNLRDLPVVETNGVIFVAIPDDDGQVEELASHDALFGGAAQDIGDLHLEDCAFVAEKERRFDLNWKLAIDTFLEGYHVFALHPKSLAPRQLSTPCMAEDHGRVAMVAGVRKTMLDEMKKPLEEREFTKHATPQYFLYPNSMLVHQIGHIESWQMFPGRTPGEAILRTRIYGYGEITDKYHAYLLKNLELLTQITDTEDFPQAMRTQAAMESGAIRQLTFGRNEPGLIYFHRWLTDALN